MEGDSVCCFGLESNVLLGVHDREKIVEVAIVVDRLI